MSRGHFHTGAPGMTQNQGNVLGDRPCVRQSRLYREHCGGNSMKDLMGHGSLKWKLRQQEGVYAGRPTHDDDAPQARRTTDEVRGVVARQPPRGERNDAACAPAQFGRRSSSLAERHALAAAAARNDPQPSGGGEGGSFWWGDAAPQQPHQQGQQRQQQEPHATTTQDRVAAVVVSPRRQLQPPPPRSLSVVEAPAHRRGRNNDGNRTTYNFLAWD